MPAHAERLGIIALFMATGRPIRSAVRERVAGPDRRRATGVTRSVCSWDGTGVERDEVEACYHKHAPRLVRLAATIVGPADAEDIVASVMVALIRSERSVDDLSPYLYRAVVNECRKHWRSIDRRKRRESLCAGPELYEHTDYVPEIARSLARLSPQQRAVVHLAYWEDLTPANIATRVGVGEGTVRRQLARARRKLAEVVADET